MSISGPIGGWIAGHRLAFALVVASLIAVGWWAR
jgi:hypothetical protein